MPGRSGGAPTRGRASLPGEPRALPPRSLHPYGEEHILYDPDRGELTGVIDWGDASIGDPAFDLTGPLHDYGRAFVEQMLAAYRGPAVGGTFWERASFYVRLIPFYQAAYGLLEGDEAHVRAGVQAIEAGFG